MGSWRDITKNSWAFTKTLIVGEGGGAGEYRTSYAIHQATGLILNGRISAEIRLHGRHPNGAGLICRASDEWTFLAFYIAPGNEEPESMRARLAVCKHGVFTPIAASSEIVLLDEDFARFTLEFLSGNIKGEVGASSRRYEIRHICTHLPFPGYVGLVKFYGSSVVVRNVAIQEGSAALDQIPRQTSLGFEFDVFISYSSRDLPVITEIARAFRREGITYWLDVEQIKYGGQIIDLIENGVRKSRYLMPCISDNLSRSGWARTEYGSVLSAELSGDSQRIVIPLKLDNCSDEAFPPLLRGKKRVNYSDKKDFAQFLAFLKRTDASAKST